MQQIVTNSAQETEAFAARFAKTLRGPVVVAFFGGLGMGKTAFTRGLAKGLGITQEVSSPTFALVHEYHGDKNTLYQCLWRVEQEADGTWTPALRYTIAEPAESSVPDLVTPTPVPNP